MQQENYRPISILPAMSKLLECHIHKHFYNFLQENDILSEAQSGFRKKFSCQTALSKLINNWVTSMNEGKLVGAVFLDLKRAFDVINHTILLEKFEIYGCTKETVSFFKSYLEDRSTVVSIKDSTSKSRKIVKGIAQGSLLGPLFFAIYVNCLPLHLTNSGVEMYADDTTITVVNKCEPELDTKLNVDVNKLDKQ